MLLGFVGLGAVVETLGAQSLFERCPQEVSQTTLRRLEEVECLLTLQQQLRGPH